MSAKDIIKNLKKARADYKKVVKKAIVATAIDVRNNAVTSIQQQSQGELSTRSRQGGGTYQQVASKAGDAPNTDTGKLVQSIAWQMAGNAYKTAWVGTNVKYAPDLEFGTRHMAARPFLTPALEKANNEKVLEKNLIKFAKVV